MDFRAVLKLITEDFSRENIRWALIGGFALGVLGVPRATIDIDLLIYRDDRLKVDDIMKLFNLEDKYNEYQTRFLC